MRIARILSLALSLTAAASAWPAGGAAADPDELPADTLGIKADEAHPIAVTARLFLPEYGDLGTDLLADYDPRSVALINGADIGVTSLLVVVGLDDELGERTATLTVTNHGHTVRRRWKARPALFELLTVEVDTCEPIKLTVAVGRTRLARTIRTACFE